MFCPSILAITAFESMGWASAPQAKAAKAVMVGSLIFVSESLDVTGASPFAIKEGRPFGLEAAPLCQEVSSGRAELGNYLTVRFTMTDLTSRCLSTVRDLLKMRSNLSVRSASQSVFGVVAAVVRLSLRLRG